MLALVREGALVERFEENFDLFLEELPVGVLIEHWRTESFNLAAVISTADAEAR